MSKFVRASKVRHVFCQPDKSEHQYHDLRLATGTGDHNYIKANSKYFACCIGRGSLMCWDYAKVGKLPPLPPSFTGHKGAVLDFDFNPFHDQIIVSGSDDGTAKLWEIPKEGLKENCSDALVTLKGHQRKIVVCRFNPNAESVLATGSADFTVKLWDVEKGVQKLNIDGVHEQLIQDVVWSYDGSQLLTSCKDKNIRLFDPRSKDVAGCVQGHEGSKTSKLVWLGKRQQFVSVGFTRQSKRQFKIWDPKNLTEPVCTADIDQAAGVIMPFYDEDTNLLYLQGKGDGNVRYFEIVDETPWQFHISEYRSSNSAKGFAMLPKRACDVMKCEVARFLKLTSRSVEPLSFIIPRKSELFQDDIFPDAASGVPAMTCDELFAGTFKPIKTMSLDPEKRTDATQGGFTVTKAKSAAELQKELDTANAKIAELEAKLKAAGIA